MVIPTANKQKTSGRKGLYVSEHYGTLECIRVVNVADKLQLV